MSPWSLSLLFLTGLFGAWLAKSISGGMMPWWMPIVPSVGTGLLWGWVSRRTQNLTLATMVFDTIYTGAFVVGFIMLGDKLNSHQIIGVVLTLIGIALMA